MLLLIQPLCLFYKNVLRPEISDIVERFCEHERFVHKQQHGQFFFRYFINLNTGEAVLNIIAHASSFTKFIFMW